MAIPSSDYKKLIRTQADKELPAFDHDLAISITGEDGIVYEIPVWRFIEKYMRIKDKSGHNSAFELNPAQINLYKRLCLQRRANKPMRVNILKARQLGFSTFISAIIFVLTIMVPNQTACIVADIAEHATNLFSKYKFYYDNLPKWLKNRLPEKRSNAKVLEVDYGKGQSSVIRVLVQGENAGRSDTCQFLHLSEVAFWQDIEGTTTSILQTVDDANPNSLIVYETTANGVNYYKKLWDEDVANGAAGFEAIFFGWHLDPKHVYPYDGFDLFDWEKKIKEENKLSLEQIAWYRTQYAKMRGNLLKLRQEHPSNPIEAFIVSGSSVFNMELLQEQKAKLIHVKPIKRGFFSYKKNVSQDGNNIQITDIKFIPSEEGEIKIYEMPNPNMPYVVCNDPAMGGEDYFAHQVINNYTGKQAAVYHKNHCDADEAAYQLYCLAHFYSDLSIGNKAMITGETNTTSYLLKICYKCGWRNIYQDQDYEALAGRFADKFGYKTKQNNRQVMIDMFAEAFRDNPDIIQDYETICEMENFQVVKNENTGKEKIEATSGAHDDLVMAYCGFYLCRRMQKATPYEASKRKLNVFDPLASDIPNQTVKGDFQWE